MEQKKTNPTPTVFESALLDALLAGDHPYLSMLRLQRLKAIPVLREWSTAGEVLTFHAPSDVALVSPGNFELHDVKFDMEGVDHPFGGANLFIRKGAIDFLETFSYVDDFPAPGAERFTINYFSIPDIGGARNLDHLQSELEWRLRGMPRDSMPAHLGIRSQRRS